MDIMQRKSTAYHEAGHAVADWRLGFKVKFVTIVMDGDCAGYVRSFTRLHLETLSYTNVSGATIGRWHERIVSILAGPAAQRLFNARGVRSHHARGDIQSAFDLLNRLHADGEIEHAFRYLEARANNLVKAPQNWCLIQALAKTLLERSSLTGGDVEAVLRASLIAQMQAEV